MNYHVHVCEVIGLNQVVCCTFISLPESETTVHGSRILRTNLAQYPTISLILISSFLNLIYTFIITLKE